MLTGNITVPFVDTSVCLIKEKNSPTSDRVVPEYAEVPVSLPSHSLYEMKKKEHLHFINHAIPFSS